MSSEAFAERVLKLVGARGYKPRALHELAEALGVGEAEQGDFHDACKALAKSGRIVLGNRNAVTLPEPPSRLHGSFRANPRGFGFVVPDVPNAHGDIYVPAGATRGAMTGDRVVVDIRKRGQRGGRMLYEGRVASILQRSENRFVGELKRQFSRWLVIPDGATTHAPILVGDPGAKNAKPGDQVVVEIIEFPTDRKPARGVIVKRLGPGGDPGVDAGSVIELYRLPGDFPVEVEEEARRATTNYDPGKEAARRTDLSDLVAVTIDPDDARDFDDAVSLERIDGGTFELGVHIADVAHFVVEGGPLDLEARERANSVYLPGMVIPMLPEVLSNGVCSLQEGQPRLTRSVFITYDREGDVRSTRFARSIIRSRKRLTYRQATSALEGKPGRLRADVVRLLRDMEHLARIIQQRRRRQGMLTLSLRGVDVVLDDGGRPVDVTPEDTSFSHTIIEMFMVEANEAVARRLADQRIPFLRRIHEDPDDAQGDSLRRILAMLGHHLPRKPTRRDLQQLLDEIHDKPEAFAVNLAVLRSMKQAAYSPANLGHYALASSHYCHFTSPIRRYPDLTIHRLLDADPQSPRKGNAATLEELERDLTALGDHCSSNERRAEAAERELKLIYTLRLLQNQVGQEFRGIVTGVSQVGVFVQLERYLVDGLIRLDHLGDDWWEVDASSGEIIGQRSGKIIRLGDFMSVRLAAVSIPKRNLDLIPASSLSGESHEKPHLQTARRPISGSVFSRKPNAKKSVRRNRSLRRQRKGNHRQ